MTTNSNQSGRNSNLNDENRKPSSQHSQNEQASNQRGSKSSNISNESNQRGSQHAKGEQGFNER